MNVQSLHRWQWAVVGVAAGAAIGGARLLAASDERLGGPGFISQQKFEQVLRVPPAAGRPYVRRVSVRPAGGVDLVTLWVLTPQLTYEPTRFAAPRRYKPLDARTRAERAPAGYSVRDYLAAVTSANPHLRFRDAWWEAPAPLVASHAAAGLVLVGGLWPLVLRRLVGAGYGRAEETPYDLDRFQSGPEPSAPKKAVLPEEEAGIRALEEEMLRGLTTGGEPPAPAVAPGGVVRTLEQTKPGAPPDGPEEAKDFFGEFYPVAHPHHPEHAAAARAATAHAATTHQPSRDSHASGGRAFTLIELIVVIGLITILTSLLLPAIRVARTQAQTMQCANQLRQIGMAFHMYANNNGGWLPAWSAWHTWPRGLRGDEDGPAWTEEMIPYLGDPDSPVYHCPSFPGPERCRNYFLAGQWSGRAGRRAMKLTDVKMTSRFVLSGDKTQMSLYPQPFGTGWNPDDSDPDDYGHPPVLAWPWQDGGFHMHRGGNNLLFDDMHVALFPDYDPHAMTFHPHRMLDWAEVTAE